MKLSLSLFILISFQNQASAQQGGTSVFGATVHTNLGQVSSDRLITQVVYPRPGEIIFDSQKYCGDGDVANYYSAHPAEDYARGRNVMKIVVGYWVVPHVDNTYSNKVPAIGNWFGIGYNDLPVPGSVKKLKRVYTDTEMNASAIFMEEMNSLFQQAQNSASTGQFDIWSASMACGEYTNTNGASTNSAAPSASKIASSFINMLGNIGSLANGLSATNNKAKLDVTSSGLQALVNSTGEVISNEYWSRAAALEAIAYPAVTATTKVSDFRAALAVAAIQTVLDNARSSANGCKNALLAPALHSATLWWESFPLEITCRAAIPADILAKLDEMVMASATDLNSTTLISPAAFTNARDLAVANLRKAALMEHLQSKASTLPQNKIACFPDSSPYINKVIASLGFPYKVEPAVASPDTQFTIEKIGSMTHPEPAYALGQAAPYQNDSKAVFMVDGVKPMTVTGGANTSLENNFALHFHFNIRDVGCSDGVFYCYNDR